jgi:hypothetical protein
MRTIQEYFLVRFPYMPEVLMVGKLDRLLKLVQQDRKLDNRTVPRSVVFLSLSLSLFRHR